MSKFTVDGGEINGVLPPVVLRLIAGMERVKDYELLSTRGLAAAIKTTRDNLSNYTSNPALAKYRTKACGKNMTLWGNPKTIEAYNKERP